MQLSPAQRTLHRRALELSQEYRRLEWCLIETLQEVERTKVHKRLRFTSLFQYAVSALHLTEAVAYRFITVTRKAAEVPELREAIRAQKISVPTASRMTSVLTRENASELIAFAASHSTRELDFEVARRNPGPIKRSRVKPVAEDRMELRVHISKAFYEKLQRAQDLAARSGAKDLEEVLDVVVDEYLKRHDPVQKAERAAKRSAGLSPERVAKKKTNESSATKSGPARSPGSGSPLRVSLGRREKHAVVKRDGDQCTFRDARGERCTDRRYLHIHHIRPVSRGGGNEPENLTTLCSAHHDLVHQLGFAIEGQINWLRSPTQEYLM